MIYTRKDLIMLLPVLAAARGAAQAPALPSKTYRFEDLPVRPNGQNSARAVLNGATHSGFPVELHMTELAPGAAPHAPHHHVHEEMVLLHHGTLEVTISGKVTTMSPGSVT